MYDPRVDLWRQTWVDDSGSYGHFVGRLVDGDPCFATPEAVDADPLYKRMVFSNITDAHWSWQKDRSYDDGETWVEGIGFIEASRASAD